jgi:hypothetical protein
MKHARSNLRPAVDADQFDEYGDAGQLAADVFQSAAYVFYSVHGKDCIRNLETLTADNAVRAPFVDQACL